MFLSNEKNKRTEEYIVELLHSSAYTGPTMLKAIFKYDDGISKETFYRILRRLILTEVITKSKGMYQLNRHWLQRVYRFSKQQIDGMENTDTDHILSFNEGDKISYTFRNANLMGIYWAHTYDMVFEKHDPNVPILIFHPHEWLIYTRVESESFFLSRFIHDKKLVFFAIGGSTPIDALFKKEWSHRYRQINIETSYGLKSNEYINVLGDFIFKVSTSKRFADDIDKFFKDNPQINEENIEILHRICNRKDSMRMAFTKSKKEADKWRIKFKKHFYIPKK